MRNDISLTNNNVNTDTSSDTPHIGASPTTEALNAATIEAAHLTADLPRSTHLIAGNGSRHHPQPRYHRPLAHLLATSPLLLLGSLLLLRHLLRHSRATPLE